MAQLKGGVWKLEQADDLIVRTSECAGNLINSQQTPLPLPPIATPTRPRLPSPCAHVAHVALAMFETENAY